MVTNDGNEIKKEIDLEFYEGLLGTANDNGAGRNVNLLKRLLPSKLNADIYEMLSYC